MTLVQPRTSLDNAFSLGLGAAGLTRESARLDPMVMGFYREGAWASPFVETLLADPWRSPFFVRVVQNEAVLGTQAPYRMVAMAGRLTQNGSRRDLLGSPGRASIDFGTNAGSLLSVVSTLRGRGLVRGESGSLAGVPLAVQSAAATVLHAALQAEGQVSAAWGGGKERLMALERAGAGDGSDPGRYREWRRLVEGVDLAYVIAAGQDLADAVSAASELVAGVEPGVRFGWTLQTAWGDVILSGGTDDTRNGGRVLLLIDTGGNDTYVNIPRQADGESWLSVLIDGSGDDRYLSDMGYVGKPVREGSGRVGQRGQNGPGSAFFGLTFLVDRSGKDVYRSAARGVGSATFGVAYVLDMEGEDVYDVYAQGAGYGRFGVGILEDLAGDDEYRCFNEAQGFGGTQGVGWLMDRRGNDRYLAETELIDFPSPQDPKQNVSMAQGAASGVRLDYVSGRSLAGGVGLLFDLDGNDVYRCAVFGQGVGYWIGAGVLWDRRGQDEYSGVWYVQGAGAHFGYGLLQDDVGDDRYVAASNMSMGAGHDFSVGMLLDLAGDDAYSGGTLALGAGNANGIGAFVDLSGRDSYSARGAASFGRSNPVAEGSLRQGALTLGMFFDGGGEDSYPSGVEWARNGGRSGQSRGTGEDQVATGGFFDF